MTAPLSRDPRRRVVRRVVRGAAYSSAAWFALVVEAGALPAIRPDPTHRRAGRFDRAAHRRRHKVENRWARPKEWRAVAARYDKTAASFLGGLHLAAAFDWLSKAKSCWLGSDRDFRRGAPM